MRQAVPGATIVLLTAMEPADIPDPIRDLADAVLDKTHDLAHLVESVERAIAARTWASPA